MSIGSTHDEVGVIEVEAGELVLRRDDGGRWRLDAPVRADLYLGQRMRVRGMRSGFDLLDVTAITTPES